MRRTEGGAMKFKVGDEVRVVEAMDPDKQYVESYIGASGIVAETHQGEPWPYYVNFHAGDGHCFSARELELIPKPKRRLGKK
jgi:hypothetical protein